uniref:C-C motif chemokine n=2 Tax=Equus asinus TaxID=9793 RepID=A0A9L0IMK4_EQUAS|nr:C-C motif chemokine 16 [Equus asinus]
MPSFSANTEGGDYSSSSTTSKVVRVQRAARSESGQPAARTSPLSPPLKLNCATERMKVSMAAFFLLILILTTTSALGSQPRIPESVNSSPTCCLRYHEKVLPRKLVLGYRRALNCYLPAIIFITKKKREICANPKNKWVQEYIEDPNLRLLPPGNSGRVKTIRS